MFCKEMKSNEELINQYVLLDKKELLKMKILLQNEINSTKHKEINFNNFTTILVTIFLSMITLIGTGLFKGVDIIKYCADFLKSSDEKTNQDIAKAIKSSLEVVTDFLDAITKPTGFFTLLIVLAIVSFGVCEGINMIRYYFKSKPMRHLECVNTILENYDIMHEAKDSKNKLISVKDNSYKKDVETQHKNKSISLGWIFMVINLKSSYKKIKDRK